MLMTYFMMSSLYIKFYWNFIMNMMLFTEIFFFVIEKIYLRLIENGLVLILKEKN